MANRTIVVTGTDLFRVSAEELGTVGQWWRIAVLNGLTSPDLPGITTLQIPTSDPNAAYGIPAPDER